MHSLAPFQLVVGATFVVVLSAAPTAYAQVKLSGRDAPVSGAPTQFGPPMAPETVLGEAAGARITRGDYDFELTRLPPDLRSGFGVSEKRVVDLLVRMLVTRRLAADADAERLLDDPTEQARLAFEVERYKAQLALQRHERKAAERFDAELSKWEARARDIYQLEAKQFEAPEARMAARLSLSLERSGGAEGAVAKLRALRQRWLAGEDYATLARETDDKGNTARGGNRRYTRDELPPAVADVVFALPDGGVSEPLQTGESVALWRVESRTPAGRQPYEEVRAAILVNLRKQFIETERDRVISEAGAAARAGIKLEEVGRMVPKIDAAEIERLRRQATEISRRQQGK